MRLLFYGGCHAQVLRDYIRAAFPREVETTLVVNFELIRTGAPFPYDSLAGYDFVIFSPIENRAEYNTEHLVAACRAIGVEAICYPWLEWHGYCPGAIKGVFKDRFQWHYPKLVELAASFDGTFNAFCDHVIETFPDDDTIDACLETSTAHLRSAELRHDMPVRLADFICANFRDRRLFLISDHPSRDCYQHVLAQVLAAIGIEPVDIPMRLAATPDGEPQWRWRTPIFPRVARRLNLNFDDTMWLDDDVVPARRIELHTYLGLYFFPNSVILGPKPDAAIFVNEPESRIVAGAPIDGGARLFASRLRQGGEEVRDEYLLLQTLAGEKLPIVPQQRFEIDPNQWRSTWLF